MSEKKRAYPLPKSYACDCTFHATNNSSVPNDVHGMLQDTMFVPMVNAKAPH